MDIDELMKLARAINALKRAAMCLKDIIGAKDCVTLLCRATAELLYEIYDSDSKDKKNGKSFGASSVSAQQ
jgi:hypothetical protein